MRQDALTCAMETYFDSLSAKEGSSRRLVQDIGTLVADAETLLTGAMNGLADKSKTDLKTRLARLKSSYGRLEATASSGLRQADELIRERPFHAVGAAFGVGLLLGLLRRGR